MCWFDSSPGHTKNKSSINHEFMGLFYWEDPPGNTSIAAYKILPIIPKPPAILHEICIPPINVRMTNQPIKKKNRKVSSRKNLTDIPQVNDNDRFKGKAVGKIASILYC